VYGSRNVEGFKTELEWKMVFEKKQERRWRDAISSEVGLEEVNSRVCTSQISLFIG
jgi:hypothetical protein